MNKQKFQKGSRVKYVGYPIITFGTVIRTATHGYAVLWDDGQEAFFFWKRPPGEIGAVVFAAEVSTT